MVEMSPLPRLVQNLLVTILNDLVSVSCLHLGQEEEEEVVSVASSTYTSHLVRRGSSTFFLRCNHAEHLMFFELYPVAKP